MSGLLQIDNLVARHGLLQAVREVSLSVAEGEVLALVGANGAGKSTLLRTIAGAHPAAGGTIRLDGADITRVPSHLRVRPRPRPGTRGAQTVSREDRRGEPPRCRQARPAGHVDHRHRAQRVSNAEVATPQTSRQPLRGRAAGNVHRSGADEPIQPQSIFGVQWSAYLIFMVLVGGLGTFEGPIIGAILFFVIQYEFADLGAWYLIGLGLIAVAFALFLPRGLWSLINDRLHIRLLPVGYHLIQLSRKAVRSPH